MTRKPRVVTFRMDQATWDRMRELVPYTRHKNASSFIRAAHPYLPQSPDITNHIRNRLSGDLFQQPASRLSCEAADDQGAD